MSIMITSTPMVRKGGCGGHRAPGSRGHVGLGNPCRGAGVAGAAAAASSSSSNSRNHVGGGSWARARTAQAAAGGGEEIRTIRPLVRH